MGAVEHKAAELEPGTLVGEYRVESVLGRGAMGEVYAAVHPVIGKRAAIKVLLPEMSSDAEAVERFIQEARAVNQIGHPNIVDIFGFGVLPDGRQYFVMELLRGESLRDRLRRAPLALAEALGIVEAIAIALEAAHDKGIVHRDLKPDNVFLVALKGGGSLVKLLDFGIAKLLGSQGGTMRTQTGYFLGTPAYISPEQARGYAVDHRTDVYALGALAFELCTGSLVFEADNAADMIAKQLFVEPRRASSLAPDVPPEVDALIAQMLAKDAADRPTLEHCRAVLQACHVPGLAMTPSRALTPPAGVPTGSTPPHAVPSSPPASPRRMRIGVVAATAIAVVAIGIVVATRGGIGGDDHTIAADAAAVGRDAAVEAAPIDAAPALVDAASIDAASIDAAKPSPIKKHPPKHTTTPATGSAATGSDDRDAPM